MPSKPQRSFSRKLFQKLSKVLKKISKLTKKCGNRIAELKGNDDEAKAAIERAQEVDTTTLDQKQDQEQDQQDQQDQEQDQEQLRKAFVEFLDPSPKTATL
jgi:Ran GTPase-activating protein (RanGAP) involved in mRNA processing and transport